MLHITNQVGREAFVAFGMGLMKGRTPNPSSQTLKPLNRIYPEPLNPQPEMTLPLNPKTPNLYSLNH